MTAPSHPPAASVVASDEKDSEEIAPVYPKATICSWVSASQRMTLPPLPPLAIMAPSEENEIALTASS